MSGASGEGWSRLGEETLMRLPRMSVRCLRMRMPNGEQADFEAIETPDVAIAVPFLADRRLLLVRQFRPSWGRAGWECPAGHMEPGESPEQGGRRELQEETGYRGGAWRHLGRFYAAAKFTGWFHAFRVDAPEAGTPRPDATEFLETRPFDAAEVRQLVALGEIVHGPSLAVLGLAGVLRP